MAKTIDSDADYMNDKLEDRGYPGIPTSQADVMMTKRIAAPRLPEAIPGMGGCGVITGQAVLDPQKAMHILQQPMVSVEHIANNRIVIEIANIPNDQSLRVVAQVLPNALELYLKKSRDYGGNVMDRFGLGEKAAIPDMARKFGKLIDNIWHGKKLAFEQADEILMDLLGHIFIILDERRDQKSDDLYHVDES